LKYRIFPIASAVSALFALSTAFTAETVSANKRPNIVLIVADDLGFSDLGCYGGDAATPNLDRLAKEGVRFTEFYNCGKCEPTRTGIMTSHHNTKEIGFMAERAKTFLPAVMRDQGYHTLMAGKWHVSRHPMDRGFERFFGVEGGGCNYFTGSGRILLGREKFDIPATGFYSTDAFADFAIRFLKEARDQKDGRPFFLYLAFNAPHAPLQAPEEEISKYRGKFLEGWEVFKERRFERIKKLGLIPPDSQLSPWPQNLPHWNELTDSQKRMEDLRMATYCAMIDRMDQNVGRLFEWLKKNGEWDNTLVIFVSDNGANPFNGNPDELVEAGILPGGPDSKWEMGTAWAHVANTPFRLYKRNQHEGGICAPMIMHDPAGGYAPGSLSSLPVHVFDFLPTFHALAGGTKRPEDIEGTDLSGLWKNGAQSRDFELKSILADHRCYRRNEWKLVSVDGQPWELYNIGRDRTEADNLVKKNPEVARDLEAAWDKWRDSIPNQPSEENKDSLLKAHMGDQGTGAPYVPSPMPQAK